MKKLRLSWVIAILIGIIAILIPSQAKAYSNYFTTTQYKIAEGANKILSGLNTADVTAQTILENVSTTLSNSDNTYGIKAFKDDTEITGSKPLGTGYTLKLVYLNYNAQIDTLTVVLYGDTNSDGQITASDALAIIKNKTGKVALKNDYCVEAGRITDATRKNNSVPSAADALAIIKYKLGKATISQSRNIQVTVSSYEELYTQLGQCNTNLVFDQTASNYNELTTNYKKLQDIVTKYCTEDMSQTTKALVLHDYLVAGSTLDYETDYCDASSNESHICNIDGTMNQLGFANSYTCLLGIAGIPSKVKRDKYSNYAENAINEVTIDGQMYYVSCGADSHISKVEGKGEIRRYYFLRNTEQLDITFWEDEAYFSYSPANTVTSTSTKYYGVRWPEYRSTLDYKNSEIKLATGKKVIRNLTELKEAVLNRRKLHNRRNRCKYRVSKRTRPVLPKSS